MTPRISQTEAATSPQIEYANFVQDMLNGLEELEGHLVYASVLFIDIRDVTRYVEQAEDMHSIRELNRYYAGLQQIIYQHGGMVTKCGDDAILALFGAPIPMANHAEQAVRVAMLMLRELIKLNHRRHSQHKPPLRIGFGVNTGEMVINHLATARWRQKTLIGETVDIASYLSALNKNAPVHTLYAHEATAAIIGSRHFGWAMLNLGAYQQEMHTGMQVYAIVP